MKRVVAGVIGLAAGAALIVGCSDDKSATPAAGSGTQSTQAATAQASTEGKTEVKVDGDRYTITGEAVGADMSNPMAGMITKPFTVTVTCS